MQDTFEGQTLGRYQLQRCIGQGGMAAVYLAYDQQLQRDVAVKIVHGGRAEDLARFRREAGMLATLTHEHILPVYDSGQQGPWHYLIMPYISHGTLADRLQSSGSLTLEEAKVVLDQVANALQYAHDREILHRDIKPSNILLRDDSYAYLADFGIARSFEGEGGLTQSGFCIGTPEYMAPELFEHQASQESDIYALGIVLYMMLTGSQPFTAPSPLATMHKQFHEQPTPPSQLNPAISPEVEQVILGALAKDPHRRFQNARAFAAAYRHALQEPARFSAQPAATSASFYSDTTVEVPAAPSASLTTGTSRPAAPAPILRNRRTLLFIIPALGVLLLLLIGSLVAALSLGHQAGAHPSASVPTTAPRPTSTLGPTATPSSLACSIDDTAGLLDQNQVCQAAHSLPYSLIVKTSRAVGDGPGPGSSQQIDAHTILITIVIVRRHGHDQNQVKVTITGGSAVLLTGDQYRAAESAFMQTAQDGDYTAATIEALHTLQQNGEG
ncbi:MAG TPA: serine/threonine-protein kinase [Ktedonobacteraceae bacterium]|jgi:serine/threonine protein kinase